MNRLCLDCGTALKGRSDKKFCDDQCRSNYNNQLKSNDESFLKQINQVLRKNRIILSRHNPQGKTKIKREVLLSKGFNFEYHTHTYTTWNGKIYFFCYEYGYLSLNTNELLLVKRVEK